MQFVGTRVSQRPRTRKSPNERGVALITALLLLMLLTGLSLAMVLTINSEMLVNGYYQNFRGSFYSADSGLAIVRQDMENQMAAKIETISASTAPYSDPNATATAVLSALKSSWANPSNPHSISISGSAPASFYIDPNSFTFSPSGTVVPTGNPATGTVTSWAYAFNYHLLAIGHAQGTQQNRIEEGGQLKVVVNVKSIIPPNFSGYGLYFQNYDACSDAPFASGTITGPAFTDGCLTFGTGNTNVFTNPVGCGGPGAGYQFSDGTCKVSPTSSYTYKGTTLKPTFQGGIFFNQDKPTLPANSFSQKQAVLDGIGVGSTNPSTTAMGNVLKNVNGNPYTGASGVYVPYSTDGSGNPTGFTGGGIYVNGDAGVALSTATVSTLTGYPNCTNCYLQQAYKITQGGTTTTITVTQVLNSSWNYLDPNSNYTNLGQGVTTICSGSCNTKTVIPGIPVQKDSAGSTILDNAAMLYVDGNVTALSGNIQDDTALTIASAKDITVTGSVTYLTAPVTTSANQKVPDAKTPCCDNPPTSFDTLIPGHDKGQALGLFTANGNVIPKIPSEGNLEIDASIATISQNGTGGLAISASSAMIDKLTIVGGRIHNSAYSTNGKLGSRDVFFDKRFGQNLAPPWFPSTSLSSTSGTASNSVITFNRQQWVVQSSY